MTSAEAEEGPGRAWVEQLLEQHQGPLLRYSASIVGSEGAPDVVQEAFLRLCREPQEKVEGHAVPWLFRVCRNLALDTSRDRGRFQDMNSDPDQAGLENSPAEQLEQSEATRQALGAIELLPARQREVVRLKFAGGLSYREIAEVLGLSVNNVGVLLHRALRDIRKHLAATAQAESRAAR